MPATAVKSKNTCAKSRPKDRPYEVWANDSGWTWNVLKKYQNPVKEAGNQYARWFCYVTSPICPEPHGEYGDTYVSDIVGFGARKIKEDYDA